MQLMIILPDPEEQAKARRREIERLQAARPKVMWVWGKAIGQERSAYHAFVDPKTGVESVSFCGYDTTTLGGETKTPGATRCELCLQALTR